jgi:hypothetical protein
VSREKGLERERLLLLRAWKDLQATPKGDPMRRSTTWVGQLADMKRRLAAIEQTRAVRLKSIAVKLTEGGTVVECWDRLSEEDGRFIQEELAITKEEEGLSIELEEERP